LVVKIKRIKYDILVVNNERCYLQKHKRGLYVTQ